MSAPKKILFDLSELELYKCFLLPFLKRQKETMEYIFIKSWQAWPRCKQSHPE